MVELVKDNISASVSYDRRGHVRAGPPDVSGALEWKVEEFDEIYIPAHARRVDGELLVFDGWQRVRAAREYGLSVPVKVYDAMTDTQTLALSLALNDRGSDSLQPATDQERQAALQKVSDNELFNARYHVGLRSDREKLQRELSDVHGVGNETINNLLQRFQNAQEVVTASKRELEMVDGVGSVTADAIYSGLDESLAVFSPVHREINFY